MRWWLNTDHKMFSVDNAGVRGLDFSTLPADVWMVQWTDGKGEIERQDADGGNLNGLREPFIDVTPYAPFFQQFLRLLPGLTLPQAKKVQIDLIKEIFESKRQAPFHYPVAAGDYWWDATDATLYSSLVPTMQNVIVSVNAIVARLNAIVPQINAMDNSICEQVNSGVVAAGNGLADEINAYVVAVGNGLGSEINSSIVAAGDGLVAEINNNVVAQGNGLADQINNNIVNPTRYMKDEIGSVIVNPVNALITYVDDTVVGTFAGAGGANTVNGKLIAENLSGTPPGLNGNIVHFDAPLGYLTASSYSFSVSGPFLGITSDFLSITSEFINVTRGFASITAAPGVPWTPLSNVATASVSWIPIGGTTPVNVTPAEQAAIMQGIAARTADLNVKKNTKIAEVNALTTVAQVIAYDVTIGW